MKKIGGQVYIIDKEAGGWIFKLDKRGIKDLINYHSG
jgi:hypothetical protein